MKKTILPAYEFIDGKFRPIHITIEYKDEKLSLSGVIGAKHNGNCYGCCGQIQEDFVREWKKSNKYEYLKVCEVLKENNLYEIDGYKYGYKWLTEEVPQEVIDWLFSLPNTIVECAWDNR